MVNRKDFTSGVAVGTLFLARGRLRITYGNDELVPYNTTEPHEVVNNVK